MAPWWWRYRKARHYRLEIDEAVARYTLRDWYSRAWFLTRYTDGRLHEPFVTLLLSALLRRAATFVDVGAHLGYFTCLGSSILGDRGRVLAFELDSRALDLARTNVALNGATNVRLHHCAVSNAPGTLSYYRPRVWSRPQLSLARAHGNQQVTVDAIALDDHLRAEPDVAGPLVFKIDVEGAEVKVLEGMRETLARPDVELLIELHQAEIELLGGSVPTLVGALADAGYTVYDLAFFRDDAFGEWRELDPAAPLAGNSFVYATRNEPPTADELSRVDARSEVVLAGRALSGDDRRIAGESVR